ncbi:hypothetical protein ACROYT_G019001 [Oculina patagonica]
MFISFCYIQLVSEMATIMKLSLVIFVTVGILPSGALQCQTCTESPLQSPEQCNMSNTEANCGSFRCIALTAELMNGTLVGIRGCYSSNAGQCTNVSACVQRNESLPDGVYFERCVAECCSQERCIALTAELTNGTLVGIRGCYSASAEQCTNISACNQRNESLSGPVYFKRCVAECCTQTLRNKNVFPILPDLPSPSTVHAVPSSSIAGSANNTQASPTQAPKDPTAAGIKMKASLYFPIFLLIIIEIMS